MKTTMIKLLCIVCSLLLIVGCGKDDTDKEYSDKIDDAVSKIKVPIAGEDIPYDTFITSEMIIYEELNEVDDDVIINVSEIVGKTTANDIQKGSSFKESDLID